MNLWDWFPKLFRTRQEMGPVPMYRLGDLSRDELQIIRAGLELLIAKQAETGDPEYFKEITPPSPQ